MSMEKVYINFLKNLGTKELHSFLNRNQVCVDGEALNKLYFDKDLSPYKEIKLTVVVLTEPKGKIKYIMINQPFQVEYERRGTYLGHLDSGRYFVTDIYNSDLQSFSVLNLSRTVFILKFSIDTIKKPEPLYFK